MSRGFYSPEEIKSFYDQIVPAYQVAFAGAPWNEVSKCADPRLRCVAGLSSIALGDSCDTCGNCPSLPAYEAEDLIDNFENLAATRPTSWYAEQNEAGVTLAAIAWRATPSIIAREKYADVPEMADWLSNVVLTPTQKIKRKLGITVEEPEIMWLDEVFANRKLKPSGNLRNFGKMVLGLAQDVGATQVAYRTIEPRMLAVPQRDFGVSARIFKRNKQVPDRRDFVIVNVPSQQLPGPTQPTWGFA